MGVFEGVKKGRIYIGKSWLLSLTGSHLRSLLLAIARDEKKFFSQTRQNSGNKLPEIVKTWIREGNTLKLKRWQLVLNGTNTKKVVFQNCFSLNTPDSLKIFFYEIYLVLFLTTFWLYCLSLFFHGGKTNRVIF